MRPVGSDPTPSSQPAFNLVEKFGQKSQILKFKTWGDFVAFQSAYFYI